MIIESKAAENHLTFFYYHFQPLFSYERNLIPTHMQASFRIEDLNQYRFCLLPEEEQMQISRYLDSILLRLGGLQKEAESAIALLHERRGALISAAVTGKIDVRGLVTDQSPASTHGSAEAA